MLSRYCAWTSLIVSFVAPAVLLPAVTPRVPGTGWEPAPAYGGQTRQAHSVFEGTAADLSWPEVKKAADANALVLLPLGVIEEHGPHMPLGTDAYLAYQSCRILKTELAGRGLQALIVPPIYWGVMQSHETGAFPGSFTVRPATMKALLVDVLGDLKAWGFRRVYVVNHHGDRLHRATLADALVEAKQSLGLEFYNDQLQADRAAAPDVQRFIKGTPVLPDYHAGAFETSAMAAYFPALVDLAVAGTLPPQSTFQPNGYVGAPGNFGKIDARGIISVEQRYYADCIARWMKR